MFAQLSILAYAEYIISLFSLLLIILLQIKIKVLEENDDTPQFSNIYKIINKNIKYSQYTIIKKDCEEHYGLTCGKWFLALITKLKQENKNQSNNQSKNKIILIYLFEEKWIKEHFYFKEEPKEEDKLTINSKIVVKSFCKKDNWIDGRYALHEFKISNTVNNSQINVVNKIFDYYSQNDKRCVSCIFGPPGTGKTTIAKLLSIKIDGLLIYDYVPINTGHSWNKIINEARNDSSKPLVILIDEVDIILESVNNGIKNTNKWTELDVKDKPSWNKWFDFKINNTDNIIVIFTMNKPYSELIKTINDCSYLRRGRCDLKIQFGNYNQSLYNDEQKEIIKYGNEVYEEHEIQFL